MLLFLSKYYFSKALGRKVFVEVSHFDLFLVTMLLNFGAAFEKIDLIQICRVVYPERTFVFGLNLQRVEQNAPKLHANFSKTIVKVFWILFKHVTAMS